MKLCFKQSLSSDFCVYSFESLCLGNSVVNLQKMYILFPCTLFLPSKTFTFTDSEVYITVNIHLGKKSQKMHFLICSLSASIVNIIVFKAVIIQMLYTP